METKTYTTIDRAAVGWPNGEWDGEPDKMQWPDEATGMPCLAVRHMRSGHWCGYVGVTADHPHFGKSYETPDVDVHGGLTFADACSPGETEDRGICHVPGIGEPDHVWWFGFDCAHSGDRSPRDAAMEATGNPLYARDWKEDYKSLRYVQVQCAKLAAQLHEMKA